MEMYTSLQKICSTASGICHQQQQLKDACQLQIDATFAITQLRLINTASNLDLSGVRNGHGDEEGGTENITASRIFVSWVGGELPCWKHPSKFRNDLNALFS
jgi:hypothetical protein